MTHTHTMHRRDRFTELQQPGDFTIQANPDQTVALTICVRVHYRRPIISRITVQAGSKPPGIATWDGNRERPTINQPLRSMLRGCPVLQIRKGELTVQQ